LENKRSRKRTDKSFQQDDDQDYSFNAEDYSDDKIPTSPVGHKKIKEPEGIQDSQSDSIDSMNLMSRSIADKYAKGEEVDYCAENVRINNNYRKEKKKNKKSKAFIASFEELINKEDPSILETLKVKEPSKMTGRPPDRPAIPIRKLISLLRVYYKQ
jgi:hypothetical protein